MNSVRSSEHRWKFRIDSEVLIPSPKSAYRQRISQYTTGIISVKALKVLEIFNY